MDNEIFQTNFIEQVKLKIGTHKNWASELSELLNVAKPSIYRKIKPETFFSLHEILLLCKHYKISIDQLLHLDSDQVSFNCPNMLNPIRSVEEYLERLTNTFDQLWVMKDPKVYYTTRELPIFYCFLDDYYTAFKLYVFSKTIWLVPNFKSAKFDLNLFNPDCFKITKTLWNNYSKIHTEEFWNCNILDNTLQQILYFWEAGDLRKEDALNILKSIEKVLDQCRNMALKGSKSEKFSTNLILYNNRILHTGNHVLVKTDQQDVLYLTYDNPNFLITSDSQFTKYSKDWYDLITENSYILGKGSGHHNANFFNTLQESIELARNRIDK
ncbi:MAG: hypothetical protein IT267_03925 [Saprospiraceae bacterium]|nr:hypothetical protein [Saprospiraceae bacterium]